jgi:hypothetical protein
MATQSKKAGRLCQEAITDPMDRQEMTGRSGIGLKLMPKPAHVRIHGSSSGIAIIAPGGIQDYVPAEWTIDILQKEQQQVILGTGHVYRFAATRYFPAPDIDRHIGETNHVVSDVARSAIEDRADRILVNAGRFLWIIDYN